MRRYFLLRHFRLTYLCLNLFIDIIFSLLTFISLMSYHLDLLDNSISDLTSIFGFACMMMNVTCFFGGRFGHCITLRIHNFDSTLIYYNIRYIIDAIIIVVYLFI